MPFSARALRIIPTVRLAAAARVIRTELNHRAEYAIRFGIPAPGQMAITWPPPHFILPLAIAIALAVVSWWSLR